MSKRIRLNPPPILLHPIFHLTLSLPILSWITVNSFLIGPTLEAYKLFFGHTIYLLAISGSIYAFYRASQWGGTRSSMGNFLTFIGLGLLVWGLGQITFVVDYYLPTPLEIYDYFFIFIDPFYLSSLFFLSSSLGVFKKISKNLYLVCIPLFIFLANLILISYLKNQDFETLFRSSFFEILYIFGSSILTSSLLTTYLLTYNKLGGRFKFSLCLFFLGLFFQLIGDNTYELMAPTMTEIGSLSDFLFYISIFFMTAGVINLNPNQLKND